MSRRVSSPALVDRGAETALLLAAWADALAGQPRTVLVAGEAGIGKTRLLEALVSEVAGSGAIVLRGACVPLGVHALPYGPFRSVLADLAGRLGVQAVRERAGGSAPALGLLLPDLADGTPRRADDVVDSVARLLQAVSREVPVLLLIEDLHWADGASRDLLGYLIRVLRGGRLLVAVSVRNEAVPGVELAAFLGELERLPGVELVEVNRLGRAAVVRLITAILGHPPGAELADAVVTRSQGVPFLVEELVAARRDGQHAFPDRLRDVLLRDVRGLSGEVVSVLRAAAAAGGPVTEGALVSVTDLPAGTLRAALHELVDSHVVVVDRAAGTYDFRHALVREAVEADLLPGEAAELHARYAVLAARGSDRFSLALAAHHWWEARDVERAFPVTLDAADAARDAVAYADELGLLGLALEMWDEAGRSGRPGVPDRALLLLRAGRAARMSGRYPLARDLLADARRQLADSPPQRLAEVLWEESLLVRSLGAVPGAEDALRSLLARLPDDADPARAHTLNGLLQFHLHRRETGAAHELLGAAVAAARSSGQPAVAAHLEVTEVGLRLDESPPTTALHAVLDRCWEAAEQRDDVPLRLRVLEMQARLHLADGSLGDAEDAARAGLALAAERGSPLLILDYLLDDLCAALDGLDMWGEALDLLAEAVEVDRPNLERAALHARRAILLVRTGELDAARTSAASARDRLGSADADPALQLLVTTAEAELAVATGRPTLAVDLAREEYARHGTQVAACRVLPLLRVSATALGAAVRRGRPSKDRWLADAVMEQLGRGAAAWWSAVLRARGDDDAAATWDAVVAAAAAEDHPDGGRLLPLLAETGQRLAPPAGPGAAATGTGRQATADGAGLTTREAEVLSLLVEGRSNAQIAGALVISAKTVSVHVSHILDKLGAASRGEAAAMARARGLV